MGFSFRKSIKVAKFGRINLSKSGVGASFGTKGVRVTKSATGRTSVRATIPNTGISWTKTLKRSKVRPHNTCFQIWKKIVSEKVEFAVNPLWIGGKFNEFE